MPSSRNKPWEEFFSIKFWLYISAVFGSTTLVPRSSSRSVRRSVMVVIYCLIYNIGYSFVAVYLPTPSRAAADVEHILSFGNLLAYVVTGRASCMMCLLMTNHMKRFLNHMLKNSTKFPRLIHKVSVVYFSICVCWKFMYIIVYMWYHPSYYTIVAVIVYTESLTISVVEVFLAICQVLLFCCFNELNKKLAQSFCQAKNSIFNIISPKREVVRSLRRLHDELCDAAEDLDFVQGPATLVITAFSFFHMTSTLYQEAKHQLTLATALRRAFSLFKILWHLLTLTILIWCNNITAHKTDELVDLVHKIMHETRDPVIKKELKLFSLQLLHRKIRFTACGLFPLDFSLLYSMLGAVTAYLVILIQFQQVYEERAGTLIAQEEL